MKKNIFLENFETKTKSELLEILDNRKNYTSEGIKAAEKVLKEKYDEISEIQQVESVLLNETKDLKFYSQKAIGIATFIGGPLAAAYLIRENYLSLDKPNEGKKSLIIGIVSTILLFTGIFMIPESIMEKVPNMVLPAIYTGLIYLIVERIHGAILNQHKENENEFYSGWKAAGVGFVSLIILLIAIFGFTYLYLNEEELEIYDTEMAVFSKNESESLIFYDHLYTETNNSLLQELENTTIPKWKENIDIIKNANTINNLPPELVEQNLKLLTYSELRLKAFELYKKAISEDSTIYEQELEQIHKEIDEQLKKINY